MLEVEPILVHRKWPKRNRNYYGTEISTRWRRHRYMLLFNCCWRGISFRRAIPYSIDSYSEHQHKYVVGLYAV